MDLDGNGGKTFLRVLLHLAMHDYPPLVSGALRLLFRNFSQRQEVLQAFKQVQLLVSDRDVEHYKQIKDDLDGLRLLVEKSELWVYKTRTVEEKPSKSGAVTPTPGLATNSIFFLFPFCENPLICLEGKSMSFQKEETENN